MFEKLAWKTPKGTKLAILDKEIRKTRKDYT